MEFNKVSKEIFEPIKENKKMFEENFKDKLSEIFPSTVKDGQVDFKVLLEELGEYVDTKERYELTWAGKQNAKKKANEDIVGRTLKYIPGDSKNPETTENLYIEGDNLEVLKLLRNSYYNKVKMIYIDPPYNTGNDFVYNDDFSQSEKETEIEEGDILENERLTVNQKSNGKYHSNWLNMMYPRLKIAKDLLTDDGVIFISIDDNEVDNIKKLCCELFGEENFIGCVTRVAKTTSFRGNYLAPSKDYLLCFSKSIGNLKPFTDEVGNISQFNKVEEYGERKGESYRDDIAFYLSTLETRPNQRYFIECPDGQKVIPPGTTFPPEKPVSGDGVWRWSLDNYNQKKDLIVFKKTTRSPLIDENGNQANWNLYTKSYLNDKLEKGNIPRDIFEGFLNRNGSEDLKNLDIPFSFPKPTKLISYLMKISCIENNDIVLDFFSGSATTAHAVMQLNTEDSGNRKFICVQLPEPCDENSEAFKAGYKNICEIGKERIRRAGEKILEENKDKDGIDNLDVGFKVFKTADTNIRWFSEAIKGSLTPLEETTTDKDKIDFNDGFKDIDVVYEILLRHRDIPLSAKVENLKEIGKRTYMFADAVVVCLEKEITEEIVDKIASLEPMPIKIIFRDSAFGDNISLKENTMIRLETQIKKNSGLKKKAYRIEFI